VSAPPAGPGDLGPLEAALWVAATEDRVASLADLGGWQTVQAHAATIQASPLLPELVRAFASYSDALPDVPVATQLVIDALAQTSSVSVLTEATDVLLDAPTLLPSCAERLSAVCLTRVAQRDRDTAALAGVALEVALRLARVSACGTPPARHTRPKPCDGRSKIEERQPASWAGGCSRTQQSPC
jgi:hypothetical protein